MTNQEETQNAIEWIEGLRNNWNDKDNIKYCNIAIKALESKDALEKIRTEIEQLPTNTRTNWDGCCPDMDYPQIEYVDVTKDKLLSIIDKYKVESEEVN